MQWWTPDLLSHPISAILCSLMVMRRGGQWPGPALLGLLLGWGSLPLVLGLTREERPQLPGGLGFTPSEKDQSASDWDEWRRYYFNLRQDLIVQVLLGLIGLGLLCLLALGTFWPSRLAHFMDLSSKPLVEAWIWSLSLVWPWVAGWLLVSGYWFPWLGSIWRNSDQIWRVSGLSLPAEVAWRLGESEVPELEEARLNLLASVARSRGLHNLTLTILLVLVLWVLAQVGFEFSNSHPL